MPLNPKSPRIEVVDALRGFAIMSIMLLHNIEHFDFYYFPEYLPSWLKVIDKNLWDTLFFLFGGKSYAIFALLFGLTFFIQSNNQEKKGLDFRGRFLWRMLLLLAFGMINSVFYEGDILTFYAVLGVTLAVVCKWSNKAVLITAAILMLQPLAWITSFYIISHPGYTNTEILSYKYFDQAFPYLSGQSFWELVKGNICNGKTGVIIWSWETGRFLQAPALFMLGMLLGRTGLFITSKSNNKFWIKTLIIASIIFSLTYYLGTSLPDMIKRQTLLIKLKPIIISWSNFAFMSILVSLFILSYQAKPIQRVLGKLAPFGRMSLTNYIMQSLMGSCVYYGFGLGLYKYTGATFCFFIGICLFLLQMAFCRWWLKHHNQGPLEYIWHRVTWL